MAQSINERKGKQKVAVKNKKPPKAGALTARRVLAMLEQIPVYPKQITAAELVFRLKDRYQIDVDLRSVQRDLVDMQDFLNKFPSLYGKLNNEKVGSAYRWHVESDGLSDRRGMDLHTAMDFDVAGKFLSKLLPRTSLSGIQPYLDRAAKRLEHEPGRAAKQWSGKLRLQTRGFNLLPAIIKEGIAEAVNQALLKNYALLITYRRGINLEHENNKPITKVVYPRGLVHGKQTIYLIAEDQQSEKIMQFPLHRVIEAEEVSHRVPVNPEFSLDEYLKNHFHIAGDSELLEVVLQFDADAGRHLLETKLCEDQGFTYSEEDDQLFIGANIVDSREFRWWLLGFGSSVEVIEPESLRAEIKDMARQMYERYLHSIWSS